MPPGKMILAIDSSTELASIAVAAGDQMLAELSWSCGQNQTVELTPNIQYLLKQAKTSVDRLTAIAVARGPGSFNGLRAGISAAKGLAYSLGIPLVSAGTLEIEACQQVSYGLPVCPVMDAGRGEIATALYYAASGELQQVIEEHVATLETLVSSTSTRTVFCGQLAKYGAALREQLGDRAVFPAAPALVRRAGYLAFLGWKRLQKGVRDDINTIQPLYLREPHITRPKVQR